MAQSRATLYGAAIHYLCSKAYNFIHNRWITLWSSAKFFDIAFNVISYIVFDKNLPLMRKMQKVRFPILNPIQTSIAMQKTGTQPIALYNCFRS